MIWGWVVVGDGYKWQVVVTHGYSHGTCTHEHRYGFHVGVGLGGPKVTHGLPVTSTRNDSLGKENGEFLLDISNWLDSLRVIYM